MKIQSWLKVLQRLMKKTLDYQLQPSMSYQTSEAISKPLVPTLRGPQKMENKVRLLLRQKRMLVQLLGVPLLGLLKELTFWACQKVKDVVAWQIDSVAELVS